MTPVTEIKTGEWMTTSADETFRLGQKVGLELTGGEILLLSGPLGAGKTMFVKGLATSLNLNAEDVTSPSFTLVNPYEGRIRMYHVDLYRMDDGVVAAHAVDLDDLLADEASVIVIEWAERLGNYRLPKSTWRITIIGAGEEPRLITIYKG